MAIKNVFLEKKLSLPAVFTGNEDATLKKITRTISDKVSWPDAKKKKVEDVRKRFLVTINVVGSAGPIRFVVNGDDNVDEVIQKALKNYAREKRVPQLGSDSNVFSLFPVDSEFGELDPLEPIGSSGAWKFSLCKKHGHVPCTTEMIKKPKGNKWIPWIPKSKSFPARKLDVLCS